MNEMETKAYENRKAQLQAKIHSVPEHQEMFLGTMSEYKDKFDKGFNKIEAFIAENENPPATEVFKCLGYLEDYWVMVEKQSRL